MSSHAWPGSGQGDAAKWHAGTLKCSHHHHQGLRNNLVGKSPPPHHGDGISCQLGGGAGGGLKRLRKVEESGLLSLMNNSELIDIIT